MHNVEVEVVDAPVLELLFADGLDAVVVVEGVPELGDEEEVGALDEAVFYGASYALATFLLVAVVCRSIRPGVKERVIVIADRMHRRTDGSRI